MHPRTEEVLSYLEQTRTELRAAVDSVPPQARNTRPGPDHWSAAQVVDHLAIAHGRVAAVISKWISEAKTAGLGPETGTGSVRDTIPTERILNRSQRFPAPEAILPHDDADAETAWTALMQSHEQLRAALLSGDGLALEQVVQRHPVMGEINMYQWTMFEGSHEARHTLQVREIAAHFNSAADAGAAA